MTSSPIVPPRRWPRCSREIWSSPTAVFVEIAEDCGLPIETYPDLAEALRQCGAIGQEEIIPSIRDVTEID